MNTSIENLLENRKNRNIVLNVLGYDDSLFGIYSPRCCHCPPALGYLDKHFKDKQKTDLVGRISTYYTLRYRKLLVKLPNQDEKIKELETTIAKRLNKARKPDKKKAYLVNQLLILSTIVSGNVDYDNIDNNGNRFLTECCYTCPILLGYMRSELKKEDKKNEHELELLKENLLKLQNSDNSDENDKEMYEFILNNYKAKISELEKTIAKNKSDKNREKEWLKNYQELQDQEWLKRKARYELKLKEQQNNTQNQ